ncbi:UDP-N-acetylmuramate dehydrogenase [Pseudothermotoga elfii]|uniref:UDP-N-acetylmuramate dehydrogenase n=1 Tax=Pseudothermotoga elfii TaxID=38322 RepID=UPI00041CEA4B|nr:UDP-N-acetylmuramate dehydrogenase [Pseudothermotoga elfii]
MERDFCEIKLDEPLKYHTSFKIGGPARLFVVPNSIEGLICALSHFPDAKILGRGTNILAPDSGVDVVISTVNLNKCFVDDELIVCESGASLFSVCKKASHNSLSGLEFAYGIPGSVGGAIYMNAGAYGGQICDVVAWVEVYDGEKVMTLDRSQLEFSYRKSIFQRTRWMILKAAFKLKKADMNEINNAMEEIMTRRMESQPLDMPSAGSVFKKPGEDFYVARVIEEIGLKGLRVGDAQISTKHAGFIVNLGEARSSDVLKLIEIIRHRVKEHCGIQLQLEVEIW